jgi:hypothetical protein
MARTLAYDAVDRDLTIVQAYFAFHTDDLTAPVCGYVEAIRNQDGNDADYAEVRLGCGVEWTSAKLPKAGQTFRVSNGDVMPLHRVGPGDGSYTLGRQLSAVSGEHVVSETVAGDVTADATTGTDLECFACPHSAEYDLVVFKFLFSTGVSPDAAQALLIYPAYLDLDGNPQLTLDLHGRQNDKQWVEPESFRYRGVWRALMVVPRAQAFGGKFHRIRAYKRVPGESPAIIASAACSVVSPFVA